MTSSLVGHHTRSRPRLLDVCCGAGGAAKGYDTAGLEPVGIDKDPQPNYPYDFIQGDAIELLTRLVAGAFIGPSREGRYYHLGDFVGAHGSPPCQAHTDLQKQNKRIYPDLIAPVRDLFRATGLPYVIENVEGAPLISPVTMCGASPTLASRGLRVIRHRLFESNVPLVGSACPERHPRVFTHDKRKAHYGRLDQDTSYVQVTGGGNCTVANKLDAMGVGWMTAAEANEAIPPAYTEFIGRQLMAHIINQDVADAA